MTDTRLFKRLNSLIKCRIIDKNLTGGKIVFKKGDYVKCINNDSCERFLTIGKEYLAVSARTHRSGSEMVELVSDTGIVSEFYQRRFQLVDPEPKMMKLVLHAAFTRTSPTYFERVLSEYVDGYSRVDQFGFFGGKRQLSHQYVMFIPVTDYVEVQEVIMKWFRANTNEECIIFEVQTATTWNMDTMNIDKSSWRDAVDRILANPGNLQDKPITDLQSRYGFKGGSF